MAKAQYEYLPLSVIGAFPSDWQEATLASVCHQVTDGTHDSPKPVTEGGFPLVTGKAIKGRRIDFSVTYNISEEDHRLVLARSEAEPEDILFANIGNSIGDLVRVQTSRPFSIKNVALFKPNHEKIFPRYLEYFLLSEQVQGFIKGSTRGSAQPFIGLSSLRGFPVAVPPMNEQRNIGAILGAMDDRITLLRETNATLEAIAQALFKSWFVDFDPVRAKQEGRAPEGMDEATAALFPDGFEESELGMVPRGWRVGTVADLGDVICGKTPPTSKAENYGDEVPFITIPDMHGSLLVTTTARSLSRIGADSQMKKYLPPGSVCVSCIATPGLVVRVTTESQTNQQINSVVPLASWGKSFPLFLLRRIGDDVRAGGAGGSVFHNLSKSGFEGLKVLLTTKAAAQKFGEVVEPLVQRIEANQCQAQTLATLRDTLLPRLISGQLRLGEDHAQPADFAS